jgi:transposase
LSDPLEEAYSKYLIPEVESGTADYPEEESSLTCPKCESALVDRSRSYRGELKCTNCGHFWRR